MWEVDHDLACIALDLEEDWSIPGSREYNPTFDYLDDYVSLVDDLGVPLSVFAVGETIERHPPALARTQVPIALDRDFAVVREQQGGRERLDRPDQRLPDEDEPEREQVRRTFVQADPVAGYEHATEGRTECEFAVRAVVTRARRELVRRDGDRSVPVVHRRDEEGAVEPRQEVGRSIEER